jgi:hypothetical protein
MRDKRKQKRPKQKEDERIVETGDDTSKADDGEAGLHEDER